MPESSSTQLKGACVDPRLGLVLPLQTLDTVNEDKIDFTSGNVVWEGSVVLCEYIRDTFQSLLPSSKACSKKPNYALYELGCGIGICALGWAKASKSHERSPSRVIFQDMNPDVLREKTVPAVQLNLEATGLANIDVSYVGCSWSEMTQVESEAPSQAFKNKRKRPSSIDEGLQLEGLSLVKTTWPKVSSTMPSIILCSECVYSSANFADLASAIFALLSKSLKRGSFALVSGKRMYFGSGGGVSEFEMFLKDRWTDQLTSRLVHSKTPGRGHIFDILRVERC